jgi:hypothetical protein
MWELALHLEEREYHEASLEIGNLLSGTYFDEKWVVLPSFSYIIDTIRL